MDPEVQKDKSTAEDSLPSNIMPSRPSAETGQLQQQGARLESPPLSPVDNRPLAPGLVRELEARAQNTFRPCSHLQIRNIIHAHSIRYLPFCPRREQKDWTWRFSAKK